MGSTVASYYKEMTEMPNPKIETCDFCGGVGCVNCTITPRELIEYDGPNVVDHDVDPFDAEWAD